MHMISLKFKSVLILSFSTIFTLQAQGVYDGYVLYDAGNSVQLVNKEKQVVWTWDNLPSNPYGVYLTENGTLLRPCETEEEGIDWAVSFGAVQELDKFGNILWEFHYKNDSVTGHHDIQPMPNGNFLMIAYEIKSQEDAQARGFDTEYDIMLEQILEIKPPKPESPDVQVVWKWHIWDHLTIGNEQHLFNVNMGTKSAFPPSDGSVEWMHMNGIQYNAKLDQIIFSSRYFSEIYIIDHSTTTAEAAGHTGGKGGMGGDILFRWGNPENYGSTSKRWIANAVHCPSWIPDGFPGAGNLIAFINTIVDTSEADTTEEEEGIGRTQPGTTGWGTSNSAIYEVSPQLKGTHNYESGELLAPIWSFEEISSAYMSGVQRLPNGNTFICEAANSRFLEVSQDGMVVWEYKAEPAQPAQDSGFVRNRFGNITPRATKYGAAHEGIQKVLDPTYSPRPENRNSQISGFPLLKFDGRKLKIQGLGGEAQLGVYRLSGDMVSNHKVFKNHSDISLNHLDQGVYFLKLTFNGRDKTQVIYKL